MAQTQEVRQNVIKLGQKITNRLRHTVTADDPEYWGLAGVLSDDMADLALLMKVRKPYTAQQLAKKSKKSLEETTKLLEDMSWIGVVEYNWENPKRQKQYVLPMFVPGSGEFMNMNPDVVREHPEVADFFHEMSRLPLEKITPMVPLGGAGIGMHVIPIEKAIESEQESVSVEHISHWLKKYEGKYAVGPCSCRASRRARGEGCGHLEEDMCLAVGDMADYIVETNKGRPVDYEEALEILKRGEDNGLVHQITNIDGEDKIFAICNCCICSCYALRTSQLFNTPNLSRSAYVARTNPEECVACGRCVEHCPAGAAKLGQSLCTTSGPIVYPVQELPDEVAWGPEKWNENYRDDNQINCYDTGTAPCKTNCPAHIAVQGYIKKAAQGEYLEALKLIKLENPFPAVCGRICNHRCEDACTRGDIDEPLAIDEIKRFIAELELKEETRYIPPMLNQIGRPYPQKIAIVGAGPAGMTCAFFLAQKGYSPTVFEAQDQPGGMLRYGIPSFKLEKDVLDAEIDVLRAMGVEFKCGVEVGKDVSLDELRKQGYEGFYLAIGCQGGRAVNVPGEDAQGVMSAVDYLRMINADETQKLPGKTVVVGGGNVAIDVARCAVRAGAQSVGMYCLETLEEMPATPEERIEAEAEGVSVNTSWGPKEILQEDGKVTGIVFKKCTRVFDDQGAFAPEYDDNDTLTVACDTVVLSVGHSIKWGALLDGSAVELGRGNCAQADSLTYQTAQEDVFVGGDVYSGPSFAIDAIAAGKEAAISLHRFVHEGLTLTIGRNRRDFVELDKKTADLSSYDTAKRQVSPEPSAEESKATFRDLRGTFTEEQVKLETERCLSCGATIVDENRCVGCGVCTNMCEFDAIKLYREHPGASTMRRSEDKLKAILPYMLKRNRRIKKAQKAKAKAEQK